MVVIDIVMVFLCLCTELALIELVSIYSLS